MFKIVLTRFVSSGPHFCHVRNRYKHLGSAAGMLLKQASKLKRFQSLPNVFDKALAVCKEPQAGHPRNEGTVVAHPR